MDIIEENRILRLKKCIEINSPINFIAGRYDDDNIILYIYGVIRHTFIDSEAWAINRL